MSCGVSHRYGLDPALLWLWCRPAAVAQIRPLAWESPYTAGMALKSKAKQNKTKQNKKTIMSLKRTQILFDLKGYVV